MVWFAFALVFLLLAAHPFLIYPLSLRIAARRVSDRASASAPPENELTVAIVMCAYNEEAVIEDKLRNCLSIADAATRIFVYTDGCSDRTVEIATRYEPRVRVLVGLERRGKSSGMNQLARAARAEGADILFFTDANVILDDKVLHATRAAFADSRVGCVTGHVAYVNGAESATARVGAGYWSVDENLKRLETRSGSCMGADGALFAIRASTFKTVPENIIDDFFTSMSILCDGWLCIYSPDIIASERSATGSTEEYRRKIRIACRAFNCHRLLWPRLRNLHIWDLYKYMSHKLLRWLTIYWVAGATVCLFFGLLTAPIPLVERLLPVVLGLAACAAVARIPGPPWSYGREAFLAVLATGVGVVKSLQGERFQTWSPAVSTREGGLKSATDI